MLFATELIISFLAGGVFIALQTLLGERFTGFWRNVILTIPSTMALGFLFIGLTKTPSDVAEVAMISPAALAPDYLWVMTFALLASFGFLISIIGSFAVWAIFAALLLKFPPATFTTSVFLYALPLIIIAYLIVRLLPQMPNLKPFPITAGQITLRCLIGGSIIALIVLLASTLGNIWGGLFSAFPAAFTSTFIIYYKWQGKHVIPSVAKSLFFPGIIGFIIYALIAMLTFPAWGIWLGTLASYAGVFVFILFYFLAQKQGLSFRQKLIQ